MRIVQKERIKMKERIKKTARKEGNKSTRD